MRFLVVLLLAFSIGGPAFAAGEDAARAALNRFIEDVRGLDGRFVQTQTDEFGELISSGEGRVSIQRPGKFRWEYEKPYQQLMVCDGDRIWAYDPDLSQVTVRPAGEALAGTPAELLSRGAKLSDSFSISEAWVAEGLQHVKLTPRQPQGDFSAIEMWLDEGVPRRLRFSDPLGGQTEVVLLDLKVNSPLDAERFTFTPPAGTEVVEAAPAS